MALVTGTVGIGVFSQINNLNGILFAFLPLGAMGFTRFLSEKASTQDFEEMNYLIRMMLIINLPIGLISSIIIFFSSESLSTLILTDKTYGTLVILFSFAIPFGIIYSIFDIYFKSLRLVKDYAKFVSFAALASLLVYIPLQFLYGIYGAVVSNLLSCIVSIFIIVVLLKKIGKFPNFKIRRKIQSASGRKIFHIGLASMLMLVMQNASFLYIRTLILQKLSASDLGVFQAAFSISNNYFGLFFVIIATYSLPKLSTFNDNQQFINEINDTLKLILAIFVPAISICYVFRDQLIHLLYSSGFLVASDLLFYQLLGDFLKALSWVFGLWLLPSLKIKAWFLFDLIFYINLFLFTSILINVLDLKAVSVSYFLAYFIHAIINFIYIMIRIKFRFIGNNLSLLLYSLVGVMLIFASSLVSYTLGLIVIPVILTIWFKLSFTSNEVRELLKIFKSIIVRKNSVNSFEMRDL